MLSNNKIGSIGFLNLHGTTKLHILDLSFNLINNGRLLQKQIEKIKELSYLCLDGNVLQNKS